MKTFGNVNSESRSITVMAQARMSVPIRTNREGRVFYNINVDRYEVAVGKWIEDFPAAYQLILEEFNLPKEKTAIKYAIHWDLGMTWR